MKKALLLLFLPVLLSATVVTDVWFSDVGSTTFNAHIVTDGGGFGAVELFYAIPPNDCWLPTGGGNTRYWDGDLYYFGVKDPYQDSYISSSGKAPDTTYNVCIEVYVNNSTWVRGPTKQVHMKSAPGGGYRLPDHATRIGTSYPSDLASNTDTFSVAPDCSDFSTQFDAAVTRQQTRNTVLNLPVGKHCTGTVYLSQTPRDVKGLNATNINPDGSMKIPGHGWVTGQAILFGRKDYSGDIPNGLAKFGVDSSDGRLYYIQTKAGDPDNFWVYANPPRTGDVPLTLSPDGNNFNLVAYPRQLKWIIIRTATPDDQFAPLGVSLGSLNWLPKMAYFTNPSANHYLHGNPILNFLDPGNDLRRQSMLAKIRFVGINWTVEDDPGSYTAEDPPAWYFFLDIQPTMQDIIIDRCVFMTPSQQQRVYTMLNWNGINSAVIHSYIDKGISFFFPRNTGSVHQ